MKINAATILIAEDDEGVRRLISEILRRQGYEVLEATDGSDALELAAGFVEPIDLLLTDVQMPKVDGYALSLRIVASHPEIKVLFMSGRTDVTLENSSSFIRKPFRERDLLGRIRENLRGRAPSAP